MYIKRIRIKNFQVHDDLELEFSPNLNFIVGETDSGKTSIIRALRWVFYNRKPKNFRKFYTDETSVEIEYDNGFIVKRIRSDAVNRYVIKNGEEKKVYDNFGNDIPEDVKKVLKVYDAKVDDNFNIELNVSSSLEPVFLLDKPNSFKAKVISNLSGTSKINNIIQDFNKDIKNLNQNLKVTDSEVISLSEQIVGFRYLEQQKDKLESVEGTIEDLEDLEKNIENLIRLSTDVDMYKAESKKIKEDYEKIVSIVKSLPDISDVERLVSRLRELEDLDEDIELLKEERNSLENNIEKNDNKLNDNKKQYGEILIKVKKCPICYSDIDKDMVHDIVEHL